MPEKGMSMSTPDETYWFRAKRFGWGWGFPTCWQGWLVFAAYFGLFLFGFIFLRGKAGSTGFIVFASVLTLAMLLICWKKGEPLRWRWGGH
jgi:hypothetical protein